MSNTETRKHSRSTTAKTSAKPRRAGPARPHEQRPGAPVSIDSEAAGNTDAGHPADASVGAPVESQRSGIPKGPSDRSIQLWPIEKLRPYERNPRMHSRDQVTEIAASIIEFGFVNPVLVATDAGIIAGHGRLLAARELELTMVPVLVLDHLTPAQRRAYVIADNRLAERATWDKALLAEELRALYDDDFSLRVLGFSDEELEGFLGAGIHGIAGEVDPDSVPLPPDDPKTRPGDLWILGEHRLLCGDSSKPEDVDRLLAGAPIHLVNTDPPYNVKVEPRSNNAIAAGLSLVRRAEDAPPPGARPRAATRCRGPQHPARCARRIGRSRTTSSPTRTSSGCSSRGSGTWRASSSPGARSTSGAATQTARTTRRRSRPAASTSPRRSSGSRSIRCSPGRTSWATTSGVSTAGRKAPRTTSHLRSNNATDVWAVKKINPQSMVHLTEKPVELAVRAMTYSVVLARTSSTCSAAADRR